MLSLRKPITALALLAILYCPNAAAQAKPASPHQSAESKPASAKPTETVTLIGAGDIAGCKNLEGARATAALIDKIPGTVFAAGDLAYEKGSPADFRNCYGPTWGRFKNRTRPALGNHEYGLPGPANAYFQYWGAQAGPVGKGYYSYDIGAWHIIALNTNCTAEGVGGCASGSPQETWLKEDLAAHSNVCILAYGHHALFSSGIFKSHAVHPELKPLWQDLYAAHADLILAGHEHSYERFAPQDPDGHVDPKNGIREIVVGTGGRSHDLLGFALANSEVRDWSAYGIIKLTLAPTSYTWEFIPAGGASFQDSGSGICHNVQPSL